MPNHHIDEVQFQTFQEFASKCSSYLFDDGLFTRGEYLFRGQGSSYYKLQATFDRAFCDMPLVERTSVYETLICFFRDEMSRIGCSVEDENNLLALAQHHGMPTRLLDWTSSPLVAAYFAFHQRVSSGQSRDGMSPYVSIWALRRSDPIWNKRLGVEIIEVCHPGNDRAHRQLAYATNLQTADDCLEDFAKKAAGKDPVLWKFNICAADARPAFSFLDACNINSTQLFGDIEGAVRTAVERLALSRV